MTENKCDLFGISEASLDGEFMEICHPSTGEPLIDNDGNVVGISLVGRDSSEYRGAQRSITNRRLSRKSNSAITAERLESEGNEVLARCTKSWVGIVLEGESLECNFANALKLYNKVHWLKEQVDEFVSERSNFLAK